MIRLEWSFDPFGIVPLAVTGALYATGVVRLWVRAGIGQSVKGWQAGCFAAGWFSLFAALVAPLHELGEHLFTAHMIEHEILMAIAAPLLALSRPIGAFLYALPKAWRHWLSRGAGARWISVPWHWLTRPLDATIVHGVAIWIWHVPVLFDATIENETMHRLQHISFLVTALFFWRGAVSSRSPRLRRRCHPCGDHHGTYQHMGRIDYALAPASLCAAN